MKALEAPESTSSSCQSSPIHQLSPQIPRKSLVPLPEASQTLARPFIAKTDRVAARASGPTTRPPPLESHLAAAIVWAFACHPSIMLRAVRAGRNRRLASFEAVLSQLAMFVHSPDHKNLWIYGIPTSELLYEPRVRSSLTQR